MTGEDLRITVHSVARSALDGDELWLCIAQTLRQLDAYDPDASNPTAVELVEALLKIRGGHALLDADCNKSNSTLRVLILPELAFGSSDRQRISSAVASYNRPLLLIAGAGFTMARMVRADIPDFPENATDERYVNFGCAWVHDPTAPVAPGHNPLQYCKNHCEQSEEIPHFDPVEGTHILAIQFNDLTVFPVVCADLLQQSQHQHPSVIDRVKAHSLEAGKPTLLAASLLQTSPWHAVWAASMALAVQSFRGALVIANIAQDARPSAFADDAARNLSGAYTAVSAHGRKQPSNFCSAGRHEAALSGAVLRDCIAMIAAGPLRLQHFTAVDSHIWMPKWSKQMKNGDLSDLPKECLLYEIPRVRKRVRHQTAPASSPLERVQSRLDVINHVDATKLFMSVLCGLSPPQPMVDPSESIETNLAIEAGLRAADALHRASGFDWSVSGDSTLIYRFRPSVDLTHIPIDTYTWRSPWHTWRTMQVCLQRYADDLQGNPALIVFAADMDGKPVDTDLGRRDVTLPQDDSSLDNTAARTSTATVVCLPLDNAVLLGEVLNDANLFAAREAGITREIEARLRG